MSEEPEKTSVRVEIAGEEHAIRASVDPEHTRRCAALVDDTVREIKEKSGVPQNHRAVILAALSVADRYFRAVAELQEVTRETAERATRLHGAIEGALEDSDSSGSVDEVGRA